MTSVNTIEKNTEIVFVVNKPEEFTPLKQYLEFNQFSVTFYANFLESLLFIQNKNPRLIIVDLLLNNMDGIEYCNAIINNAHTATIPVIIVSDRNDDYSQIASFNNGASDYWIKPLKGEIVKHRLNSIIKRYDKKVQAQKTEVDFEIDFESYAVKRKGIKIELNKKEFEILCYIIKSPNKIVSRDEIVQFIWGENITKWNNTLNVYIYYLREKIGKDLLLTIKGKGYAYALK
jgi:two-component system alkaline phosphatase synthesis response regulator PhoP